MAMRSAGSWILAIALAWPALGLADQLTAGKRADIAQLIGVADGTKLSGQFAEVAAQNISARLKRTHPDLPPRVADAIRRDLIAMFEERATARGGLVDDIVGIYHRHFTHPEIKELLAFNRTPIGRKTLQLMPAIMSETTAAGRSWGRGLAPEVQRRVDAVLKKEGIAPTRKK